MSAAVEPVPFGRYELLERIGRGGMAEVWRARVRGPGGFSRELVVKRILPELVEELRFAELFLREARLSARLHHSNIAAVFECGDAEGEPFLALEYVDGWDLGRAIPQFRDPPPPGFAALIVREVCRALAYAHDLTGDDGLPLGLIHRDVSPSNVMLGRDGSVKLLDFGIAKAFAERTEERTRSGALRGKVGYMSPEQAAGRPLDGRSDLFGAGVVLWEALTGRRLFHADGDAATLERVRSAEVAPPSEKSSRVPPALDRICLRALARRPEDRYPTGAAMADELDEVVHQLRWGPSRLAAQLAELFEGRAAATPRPADTTTRPLPPRRRWPLYLGAGLLAAGSATAALLLLHRTRTAPPAAAEGASHAEPPLAPPPHAQVIAPPPPPAPAPPRDPVLRTAHSRGKPRRGSVQPDFERGAVVDPFAAGKPSK